ncbi:hypothetical protein QQS21_000925 [Conoideocrella luteorostrata]|uniref:Uncharacterized protein n=1 Tax=Conoideocrella luteorostrata TaxID=1105319 RepID=A0AAJ0CXX1_9HYPO|nr:hypothetical protein QQS21_000925 [Conoideocrella luteorostrata]
MGLPVHNNAASGSAEPTTAENIPDMQFTSEGAPTGAGVDTGAGSTRAKTKAEEEADRLYEEAMEEEYAKREGGC